MSSIKQLDRLTDWELHIIDAQDDPVDLTGRSIVLYLKRPGQVVAVGDGQPTYEDRVGGVVVYAPGTADVALAGDVGLEVDVVGTRSGRTRTAYLTVEPVLA